MWKKVDRLCGLVVRVPGYPTEMNNFSCKVRTEFDANFADKLRSLGGYSSLTD
jgi:hypothetical protein